MENKENFNPFEKKDNEENKRKSAVSRVLGVGEKEESLLDYFDSKLESDIREKRDVFLEKSENLKSLISSVNENLQDFLEEYDVIPVNITEKNIYVIDKEKITEEEREGLEKEKSTGKFSPKLQVILMNEDYKDDNKLLFLQTLVHEMIHMNSFQSFERASDKYSEINLVKEESGEKLFLKSRRVGLEVHASDGNVFLKNLNEAITTELTMRFDREYFSKIPEIRDDEDYKEREETLKNMLASGKMSKEEAREIAYWTTIKKGEQYESALKKYGYEGERKELWRIIEDIYQKNTDSYNSKEEVFDEFAKASLNGNLLPLARVLRKTYGMEIFKKIKENYEYKD